MLFVLLTACEFGLASYSSPLTSVTDEETEDSESTDPFGGGGVTTTDCVDDDGDGHDTCEGDCDDHDASTYPGAADEESATECMTDADGDGWGDDSPSGGVTAGTDCDDTDPAVSPVDRDGDGYSGCDGDCDDTDAEDIPQDFDSDGYTACEGDCDDHDPTTYPGAAELDDEEACMTDGDADGYGESNPRPGIEAGSDCDDRDATFNPDASDVAWDGLDQNCDGMDGGSIDYFPGDGGLAVSDSSPTSSNATVSGCSQIYDLTVDVDITHTWRGDLAVTLSSPSGTSALLHNRTGAQADDLSGTYSTSSGSLTPVDSLTRFIGESANGTWTLLIEDNAPGDNGTLISWGLLIACP